MKKIFISLVVVFSLFVGKAFADGDTSIKIQSLINKGLFKNKMEIMSLASNLSSSEKESLINRNKINGYFPMYLNSGLGFGIGSFIAKDYIGGAIHCTIDVACDVIMISMFALYAKSIFGAVEGRNGIDDIYNSAKNYLYAGIATALIVVVNRIAQIISLTVHVNRYNNTLTEVFAGASSSNTGKMAVNVIPVVDKDKLGIGLNFAIPKRNS
ncbi:MAG: P13 family porin [Treponema sp.]